MTRACALCNDRPAAVLHTTNPPLTNKLIYEVLNDATVSTVRLPLCGGCDDHFRAVVQSNTDADATGTQEPAMEGLEELIATLDAAPIAAVSE
jgi:hypothetical protein